MIDPLKLRNEMNIVCANLKRRGYHLNTDLFLDLENQRKNLQVDIEHLYAQRRLQPIDRTALKEKEQHFESIQNQLKDFYLKIPNLLEEEVPIGQSADDNVCVRQIGLPPDYAFQTRDHVELMGSMLDLESSAQLSGSRFYILKGSMAHLQRALAQWMLDVHTNIHGYQEVYVPYLVKPECMYGVGQLPHLEGDQFITQEGQYLIPTSEVSLTSLLAQKMLKEQDLPIRYVAHTPCFRKESGSYGRDTRGIIRTHQFEKVELVCLTQADCAKQEHERLTSHAETILRQLHLPYRVMSLCSGDIGFASAKTYDLEVWMEGQKTFREISSCSYFRDFQSRRMKIRYKNEEGQTVPVHTINGSGLAVGRTLAALVEYYQDEQGLITIPDVLRSYMGNKTHLNVYI